MKTRYQYIHFEEMTDTEWGVFDRKNNLLGSVEWYRPWRQWCFLPDGETVYSAGCLADLRRFMDELTVAKGMRVV